MRAHTHTYTYAQDGCTALLNAACYGRVDCVRLLLDAGADKNVKDKVRVLFGKIFETIRYFFSHLSVRVFSFEFEGFTDIIMFKLQCSVNITQHFVLRVLIFFRIIEKFARVRFIIVCIAHAFPHAFVLCALMCCVHSSPFLAHDVAMLVCVI